MGYLLVVTAIFRAMKKPFFLLLALCALISACKDEEEETAPDRRIFTFIFFSGEGDYWIAIHDNESGDLIDERQITADTTVFESNKPIQNNKIDVTIFQRDLHRNIAADVYTNIDIGAEWTWQHKAYPGTQPEPGSALGEYNLNITNVPSLLSVSVSDKFGNRLTYKEGLDHKFLAGTIICTPNINENGHTQLVSIDPGSGKQKYAMIDTPGVGATVTIDYSAFKEYDKYINFTFPLTASFTSLVYGNDKGSPISNYYAYVIQQYWSESSSPRYKSELNIGVLNSLEKYSIDLDIMSSFHYTSRGPVPTSIQYVAPTSYTVSATSIGDYTITSSTPYTFRVANFGYFDDRNVQFSYHAANGYTGKHHDAISSIMAEKFKIDLSKLEYTNTVFANGRTYEQALEYDFNPVFDIFTPYSETRVTSDK